MRFVPILIPALLLPLLAACGDGGTASSGPPADDPLDGRTFMGSSVTGHDLAPGSTITLGFSGGQVSASAGCNSLGGSASIEDGVLVASALSMTEMGCEPLLMDQDAWLVDFLGSRPTVTVDDDTLTLATDGVRLDLTDRESVRAADPVPLEGTTWTLDAFLEGADGDSAVSSVPGDPGEVPTLVFDAGTVSVFTGCNRGRASYTLVGETLEVTGLALTRRGCPGSAGDNERAVTPVLEGVLTLVQDYDTLTLTSAAGPGLVYRATR